MDVLGDLRQDAVFAGQHQVQRAAEILQEMKTISDLLGVWRGLTCPFGIRATAIPTDDFDAGMCFQPGRKRRRLAIRQQIDHLSSFQIDQDRAVPPTALKGEVVHAQHARWRRDPDRVASDQAQHGVGAGRRAEIGQPSRQAGACLAAQGKAHQGERVRQRDRATRVGRDDLGEPLGEDTARTGRLITEKAPQMQFQAEGYAVPGQISHLAPVAGMHQDRACPTQGTRRLRRRRGDHCADAVAFIDQFTQHQLFGIRQQGCQRHRRLLDGETTRTRYSSTLPHAAASLLAPSSSKVRKTHFYPGVNTRRVTTEKRPKSAGVVRAIAGADHWR